MARIYYRDRPLGHLPMVYAADRGHYLHDALGWTWDEDPDWLEGRATLVEITEAEARAIVEERGGTWTPYPPK